MLFLPLAHLCFAIAMVALFERYQREGGMGEGLRFALLLWLLGPVPMYLLWTAEQPWPNGLVWKQIALELVAMLALGALVAKLVRRPVTG